MRGPRSKVSGSQDMRSQCRPSQSRRIVKPDNLTRGVGSPDTTDAPEVTSEDARLAEFLPPLARSLSTDSVDSIMFDNPALPRSEALLQFLPKSCNPMNANEFVSVGISLLWPAPRTWPAPHESPSTRSENDEPALVSSTGAFEVEGQGSASFDVEEQSSPVSLRASGRRALLASL
jgi:hypothetical protein